jgi:SUMO ligase MMS21 Smc5/6 complex component
MKPNSRNSKPSSARTSIKPRGILVLGMHRSGTSALTRVLNLLGCALPDDLIGPGDGNAGGHWESVAAVSLNDTILASAGSSWDDWGPLNPDWRDSALKSDISIKIQEIVKAHVAIGPLFVLKDPRLCRLADLWFDGMDAAAVEPLAVLMLRNPAEVIESLESRDLMAPRYGQLLWLRHVLDAEYFSRGRKRVFCRYDQLMRNWIGLVDRIRSGLAVALPRNSPAVHAEIERFLSSELRHHELGLEAALDNTGLMAWLRRAFAILLDWSERGENPADYAELDLIRVEFDRSYSAFAGLLLDAGIAGNVGSGARLKRALDEQLTLAQGATNLAQARMEELELQQSAAAAREVELAARAEAGESRAVELEGQIAELRAEAERLAPLETEAAQLREQAGTLEADLAALTLHNTELNGHVEAGNVRTLGLEAQIAELRAEAERLAPLETEAAQLREQAGTLEADLAALTLHNTELNGHVEAGNVRTLGLEAQIAELRAEAERLAPLETEAAQLREQAGTLEADLAALTLHNTELNGHVEAGNVRTLGLEAQIAELRAEAERLAPLETEAAQLREQAGTLEADLAALTLHNTELNGHVEAGNVRTLGLEAQIAELRAEAERLAPLETEAAQLREQAGTLEADLAALTLHNTELNGHVEAGNVRTLGLEAQIAELRAEAERLAPLETEAAQLREQAGTLEADLAALQTEMEAVRNEAEHECNQRLTAETRLAAAQADLHEEALRNAELSGRISAIESALVQRQEELAQVWDQLLAAEKAGSAAEALVVQQTERRLDAEQRLLVAEAGMAELKESLVKATTAPVPAQVADQLNAEIAQLTRMLLEQELAAQSANEAKLAVEQELARRSAENSEFMARLEQQEAARDATEAARAATERKLASRFEEIARLSAMLGEECERAASFHSDSNWLREMSALGEKFPKWWLLLPHAWRRKREHHRYKRAGLFDAQAYLSAYPDVVVDGMDPVRHYILHGMHEGRTRPI